MESEFEKRRYKIKEAFNKVNSSGADIIQSEYRTKYLLPDTMKMYALIDLIETDEELDEFKRLTREYLDKVVELGKKYPRYMEKQGNSTLNLQSPLQLPEQPKALAEQPTKTDWKGKLDDMFKQIMDI